MPIKSFKIIDCKPSQSLHLHIDPVQLPKLSLERKVIWSSPHEEKQLFEQLDSHSSEFPKWASLFQFRWTWESNIHVANQRKLARVFCGPKRVVDIEIVWKSKSLVHNVVDCGSYLKKIRMPAKETVTGYQTYSICQKCGRYYFGLLFSIDIYE